MEAQNTLEKAAPATPETKAEASPVAYSLGEEIANAVTHGIGVALSIAALTMLVIFSSIYGNGFHVASSIVYGIALILLYSASTLYHGIPMPHVKRVLKVIDHSAIYLLIAGTYTPFTLVTLRAESGWWLFGLVWGIAVIGIGVEAFWVYRPKWITAVGYIAIGWLIIFKIQTLIVVLPMPGLWLLVAGGITYTVGTVFYVLKRVRYMHAVWHVFCLAGSILHFLAIVLYVLPSAS